MADFKNKYPKKSKKIFMTIKKIFIFLENCGFVLYYY